MDQTPQPNSAVTPRGILRRSGKLAYVAPVVIAAMKVESTFAASDGSNGGNDKPKPPKPPKPPKG